MTQSPCNSHGTSLSPSTQSDLILFLNSVSIASVGKASIIFAKAFASLLPSLPSLPDKPIVPGIGLFHVHGHKKECYPRYAPSFIPGAGMIDGEILETLWNPLNHTASSARSMTWYSRQEYLDAHMGDSNWKKLIHMGK